MVTDRLRLTVGIFSFVFILLLPQNSRVYLQIKTMYLSTLFNVRRVPKFKFETNLFFISLHGIYGDPVHFFPLDIFGSRSNGITINM